MYDSIKIVLSEKDLNNEISFMEEIPCRIVVSVCSENRVVGYLRNMRVEVRGTTLVVEGSLTKWVLGNNYAKPLGIWEIRSGVKALSVALGVPIEKAVVQRLDVAFNFRVKHMPWLYMRRLLYSDGFYSAHIKKETLYFSKHDCQMVFYDKIAEMKSCKRTDDIKEVLAKAKNVGIDSLNAASMIDELTSKIEHAYVKLRSRYDVAPERLERLNRWVDRGVTGMPS